MKRRNFVFIAAPSLTLSMLSDKQSALPENLDVYGTLFTVSLIFAAIAGIAVYFRARDMGLGKKSSLCRAFLLLVPIVAFLVCLEGAFRPSYPDPQIHGPS